MAFHATKQKVLNRGIPPDSFLTELVAWGRTASDDIFAPNSSLMFTEASSQCWVPGRTSGIDGRQCWRSCASWRDLNHPGNGTPE